MPPTTITHPTRLGQRLTREEGMKILTRDHFKCQYCGLDGAASFENGLMMTVDLVIPRALRGKKDPHNLVAACRPCNLLKGRHRFPSFEEAKKYVLAKREEERHKWERAISQIHAHRATA